MASRRSVDSGATSGRVGRPSCVVHLYQYISFDLGVRRGRHTSSLKLLIAFQSNLGNTLTRNSGFTSCSTRSSSASRGCRGKAAGSCLQALRAQVRKLRVRSFILRLVVVVFLAAVVVSFEGCELEVGDRW